MLPPGAVKGGAARKFLLGHANTRFTTDLDVARRDSVNTFVAELEESLRAGWGDFTGRVVPRQPPKPLGVPAAYVMRPYEIRMSYKRGSWCTVHLELGHDEIGDTRDAVPFLAADLLELFANLGLPQPAAVPVLAVHHQIAQKLHACTEAGSDRAHDLVDLQLLVA